MSTASVPRPMLDELRDFARANIVPVNSTIGLSAVIVCALDFCSPILGASGLRLIAALVAVASLWMLWSAKRHAPATGAVWRLVVGALLAFMAIGTTAASTKAHQGGWIASSSERAGAVQRALFDIRQQVAQVQDGVDRANATLNTLATPGTSCQDFDCAFFEAAPVAKFQELMARGVALPTHGQLLTRMMVARWPHRFDVIELYVKQGQDINTPFATGLPLAPGFLPGIEPALKASAKRIGTDISALADQIASCGGPTLRWVELAQLAGDKELVSWLIKHGADSSLKSSWCKGSAKTFSVSQWGG